MKIEYIKSFSKELNKIAGFPMMALNTGLGLMGVKDIAKTTRQAGMNLGTKYTPYKLKSSGFAPAFTPSQYLGPRPY